MFHLLAYKSLPRFSFMYTSYSLHRTITVLGTSLQYYDGCSALWGDTMSTLEDIQYCGEIPSVLWRMSSIVGDIISTVEDDQYCEGYLVL